MLNLSQINIGGFDLIYNPTPNTPQAAFETLVHVLLFTDAEANEQQEPDRTLRRGWWHDPQLGSLIWWYRQQPLSPQTRRDTVAHITQLLNSHPALSNVVVTELDSARNVSGVAVNIAATYNDLNLVLNVSL